MAHQPLRRSRSVSDCNKHCSDDHTTRIEQSNSLKSFLSAWEEIQISKLKSAKTKKAASASTDDQFTFPFFHMNPSDLDFPTKQVSLSHKNLSDTKWSQQISLLTPSWASSPCNPINKLMEMVGLDDVKAEFFSTHDRVKAAGSHRRKSLFRSLNLDLIITGNAGSGKSTIAQLYAEYLQTLGVVSNYSTHGSYRRRLRRYYYDSDDSDDSDNSDYEGVTSNSAIVMDENISTNLLNSKQGVFIIVGLRDQVKDILSHPKARGRFSRWIDIKDYSDDELHTALVDMLKKNSLNVQGGFNAPFLRKFICQIGRRRGQKGFENIKTLQNEVKKLRQRRAERLETSARKDNPMTASISYLSYDLIESDFFGIKPTEFYETSEAWHKLEKMAGLEKVKEAVRELVHRRSINYDRAMRGKEPLKVTCNYVFLGPPGTGKTTAATLFGQIIADLGYIESGEVVTKNPADFLGAYVGHSEERTKEILDNTKGKVLIIDEAHMFYHGSEHGTDASDIFRKGIVDTIVANVDNEPGNNRCIILMGYEGRMKEFYRNTNPGFQRRFPLESAFIFENYDDKTLSQIFDIMLQNDDLGATDDAKVVAMGILQRERDRPNFGNGGAVRNLISRAQITHSKRIPSFPNGKQITRNEAPQDEAEDEQLILEPEDFDPEYERGLVNKDLGSLLNNLVGFKDIIAMFDGYQKMAINMRRHGLDPREMIPFSFVFKGSPGTGKTTTARSLGRIYYSMGLLSTAEVLDCSVTDLIGPGKGLTGKNVQILLERALGKVLLIDEAYRLGQRDLAGAVISKLAVEALGEIVDCMTKERFAGKLVIVLAGYEKDMNDLMNTNEGLRGRFKELMFPNMRSKDCLRLLQRKLAEKNIHILRPRNAVTTHKAMKIFDKLSETEAWANARDVETLTKRIIIEVFSKEVTREDHRLDISLEDIIATLRKFLRERAS
ncbi:hypothetical protein CI102_3780 [Trichoderma harzianum]|nr:hypothetical protein CI102_3780 [Trichoderma harzianum]